MLPQSAYWRPTVIAGVALALVMAVTGIFAPVLAPHDPNASNTLAIFLPPGGNVEGGQSHILGTDHVGRDVLSRIITSFRIYLYIGPLGTLLGLLAAWLLVIVRSGRSAAPTPDSQGPLLGVPLYGLAIITYSTGVFLSLVVVAAVGVLFEAPIVCAGVFSSLLPMALVYGSVRGDRASSSPVRLADGPLHRVFFIVSWDWRAVSDSVFGLHDCGREGLPHYRMVVDSGFALGDCAGGRGGFLSHRHSSRQDLIPASRSSPAGPGWHAGGVVDKIGGPLD